MVLSFPPITKVTEVGSGLEAVSGTRGSSSIFSPICQDQIAASTDSMVASWTDAEQRNGDAMPQRTSPGGTKPGDVMTFAARSRPRS